MVIRLSSSILKRVYGFTNTIKYKISFYSQKVLSSIYFWLYPFHMFRWSYNLIFPINLYIGWALKILNLDYSWNKPQSVIICPLKKKILLHVPVFNSVTFCLRICINSKVSHSFSLSGFEIKVIQDSYKKLLSFLKKLWWVCLSK